jgi:hypothetical protein
MSIGDPPVALTNNSVAYSVGEPTKPLGGVKAKDGLIRIVEQPTPVLACFFFMH